MSSIGRPSATIDLNTTTVSAVSSLNERVEIIEGNLTTNTANISTNALNIDTINTKIGDNESDPKTGLYLDITTHTSDISTINTKIGDDESDPKTGLYLDIETINTTIGDDTLDPKTGIFLKLQNLSEGHEIIPVYSYTGVYLILLKDLIDTPDDPNVIINNSQNKHLNEILMEIEKKIDILEKNNDLTRGMLTQTGYGLGSTAIRSMATAPILFNSRSLDALGIDETTIPTFSLINTSQSSINAFAIEISNWIYSVIPKPIMDIFELATGKTQAQFIQDIIRAQNPQKFIEMEFLSRVKIGVNGDLYVKPADLLHPKGMPELAFVYLNASEIITKANKLADIHTIGDGLRLSLLYDLHVNLKSNSGLEFYTHTNPDLSTEEQLTLTCTILGVGGAITKDSSTNHISVNADEITLSVNPETKQIAISTAFIEEREAEIEGIETEIAGIYDALGLQTAGEGASSFWDYLTGGGAILAGLAGVGGGVSIATAIGTVNSKVENLEYLKDILDEGTGSHNNNGYFINSGNIGIGYAKNHNITDKLSVNGNIECDNIKSTSFISPDGTEFYLTNADKRVREEGETTTQISLTDDYYSKTELNNAGYLTSIPNEYITETELNAKGYLTSIPNEYIQNINGTITVNGDTNSGSIRLNCQNNSHYVELKAPDHSDFSGNISYKLPILPSSTGKVLTSDTSGNLSFIDQTGGSGGGSSFFTESSGTITYSGNIISYDITSSQGGESLYQVERKVNTYVMPVLSRVVEGIDNEIYINYENIKAPNTISTTATVDTTISQEPEVISGNLVAWYKFDDNLEDSSGNGNHLTAVVDGHTFQDGKIDKAILFNSDRTTEIRTTNNFQQINQDSSFSVSVWVKLVSINSTTNIFTYGYSDDSNTNEAIGLKHENTNKFVYFIYGGAENSTTNTYTQTDKFYHIVLTITSGNQKIYVDGVLAESFTDSTNFDTQTSKFHIGYATPATWSGLDSTNYLDDFRIYNKALSATEISNLYNHHTLVIPYSLYTDTTHLIQSLAEFKTGVNGWRIVRFLPPTSTVWHPTNDNLVGTTPYGTTYDYSVAWSVAFGNFDEFLFGTGGLQHWMWVKKDTITNANTTNNPIIKSSKSNTAYSVPGWYIGTNAERPLISLNGWDSATSGASANLTEIMYIENSYQPILNPSWATDGGMCVWVRSSTDTETVNPAPEYKTLTFTHDGSTDNQTSYTVNFTEETECDILIVGGGGAGADSSWVGGGGAGGLIYYKKSLTGSYKIKVGKGGGPQENPVLDDSATTATNNIIKNGSDSEILDSLDNVLFKAVGGSMGMRDANKDGLANDNTFDGGSSGGSGYPGADLNKYKIGNLSSNNVVDGTTVLILSAGGESNNNDMYDNTSFGTDANGNQYGMFGSRGGASLVSQRAGGGGGAGSVGENGTAGDNGVGSGGDGKDMSLIFGSNAGDDGWFAGGGGGGGKSATVISGLGGKGGGGDGNYSATAESGLTGTGGGGGASDGGIAGSGGSGIVIIRYSMGTSTTTTVQTIPSGYLKYDKTLNNYTGGWTISNQTKEYDTLRNQLDLFYWDNGQIIIDIEYSFDNANWYEISQGDTIDFYYVNSSGSIQNVNAYQQIYFRMKRCSLTNVYKNHYWYSYYTYSNNYNAWDSNNSTQLLTTIAQLLTTNNSNTNYLNTNITLDTNISQKDHTPITIGTIDFSNYPNAPDGIYRLLSIITLQQSTSLQYGLSYTGSGNMKNYSRVFYINKITTGVQGGTI